MHNGFMFLELIEREISAMADLKFEFLFETVFSAIYRSDAQASFLASANE